MRARPRLYSRCPDAPALRRIAWLAALALAASACVPAPVVYEGKHCSDEDLCPAPLHCVRGQGSTQGVCRESADAVVADAGTATFRLVEDFEGPALEDEWSIYNPTPNSVALSTEAAHRGAQGLRHTDADANEPAPGSGGNQLTVFHDFSVPSERWYLRTWLRTSNPASGGTGDRTVMDFKASNYGSRPHICELRLRGAAQHLVLGGFNAAGDYDEVQSTATAAAGEWHLVELAVEGAGSASGRCAVWLNGSLVAESNDRDWSGASVDRVEIAQPWSLDRTFTGTTDFDDVRLSTAPNATGLAIELAWVPEVDACVPVRVSLRAADGIPANAPYDADVTLTAGEEDAPLYADAACANPSAQLRIPRGASSAFVYLKPTQAITLRANHPDFLPGESAVDPVIRPEAPAGCVAASAPVPVLLAAALLLIAGPLRRRFSARWWGGVVLAVVVLPATGQASAALDEAMAQIRSLEPEAALKILERERQRTDITPKELAKIHLYSGLAHAQLAQVEQAEASFRAARLLDPELELPEPASPAVRELWVKHAPPAAALPEQALPTASVEPPQPARPSWRTATGWTLVAIGAATAATGLYFGAQANQAARTANERTNVGESLRLARDSQSAARTANILFGAAGAVAAGGGVLLVF